MADGWVMVGGPGEELKSQLGKIQQYAREAGRDPASIGIQGGLRYAAGPDQWRQDMAVWESVGATHVGVATRGAGLESVSEHIDALRKVKQELG